MTEYLISRAICDGISYLQVHDRNEEAVEELAAVQLFLDRGHQLPLAGGGSRAAD